MNGDIAGSAEAARLVQDHLHVPYAYPALRSALEANAEKVIATYLTGNTAELHNVEFSERAVSVNLEEGVSVVGRIDLVRRLDSDETTIVDLKSSDRAQTEEVTEKQLHIYALGYKDLTGHNTDYVEVYELDEGRRQPRSVDDALIENVKQWLRTTACAANGSARSGRSSESESAAAWPRTNIGSRQSSHFSQRGSGLPTEAASKIQPTETGNPNSPRKGLTSPASVLFSITTRLLARVKAT